MRIKEEKTKEVKGWAVLAKSNEFNWYIETIFSISGWINPKAEAIRRKVWLMNQSWVIGVKIVPCSILLGSEVSVNKKR
jgi:hypothetical protein